MTWLSKGDKVMIQTIKDTYMGTVKELKLFFHRHTYWPIIETPAGTFTINPRHIVSIRHLGGAGDSNGTST
jgi:hypothetical protein